MLELAPSRQSLLERALSIVTGARCGEGVLTIRSFAFVNVVLVGVWLLLALGIAREHRQLVGSERETRQAA
jgi:hypothetical protein